MFGIGGGWGVAPTYNRSHLHRQRNGKLKSPANITSINDFKGRLNSNPINTEIALERTEKIKDEELFFLFWMVGGVVFLFFLPLSVCHTIPADAAITSRFLIS